MMTSEFRKYFHAGFVKSLITPQHSGKLQLMLLLNFTSILYDCLLISWVTTYTYNREFNTCLLYQDVLSMTCPSFYQARENILARSVFLSRVFSRALGRTKQRVTRSLSGHFMQVNWCEFYARQNKVEQTCSLAFALKVDPRLAKFMHFKRPSDKTLHT